MASANKTCDVLVIGAGPAGSTAARFAARQGVSVILLERREQVGVPVRCAEYVPLPIGRFIELNRPGLVVQAVRSMKTFIPGQAPITTTVPGVMIGRDLLDQGLAQLAVEAGAIVWTGIQAWGYQGNRVMARGQEGPVEITCRVIVGADGPSSQVNRWMGNRPNRRLWAAQYRVRLVRPLDHTRIYFRPYITGGYGWLFPKGHLANVGIGIDPALTKGVKQRLDRFTGELVQEGLIDDSSKKLGGGLVPVGGLRAVTQGNMILAGDAAGTCHPITGAGVGNALISGEMAGEAAAEAVRKGDLRALQDYAQELSRHLGRSLNHGVRKRKAMIAQWNTPDFLATIRPNWIAFKEYYREQS